MRRHKWSPLIAGIALGITIGIFLKLCLRQERKTCPLSTPVITPDPMTLIGLNPNETLDNSGRTLVFVGVMTAEQYLRTRAKAVYDTWGKELPGRISFFSSEVSRAKNLPLVSLRGVDDRYPPQKKSFLMLLYMFENFGDKFEWFMRADDDVYVRGDKLGEFLRSVDSRKPQFIGQAGRGTTEERDALSLDYNENFCMGGPGVLMSRETLKRVAPHIKYCLKHLYTTHEDVEIGRCVAKFAGVSCTWSYDMQTILHHNGSGNAAYTHKLKLREVHRAITLHPIKDHRNMYRVHSYFKNLHIQGLREQTLDLHQAIAFSMKELGVPQDQVDKYHLHGGVPLFPVKVGQPGYLGNNSVLGALINMNRYKPASVDDIIPFDYISKSVYSMFHANPKRRLELPLKEALDDVIREVMEMINAPSRQRGRVIDFNELLYGYVRLDPVHGVDYILDLLLKYKRYRGRKMTVAVRRHAYLQQTFTGIDIRELPIGEIPYHESSIPTGPDSVKYYEDFDEKQNGFIPKPIKGVLKNGLSKLQSLQSVITWNIPEKDYNNQERVINFVLPLSGRYETFKRFMRNYEDVVLKTDEAANIIIVLYKDIKHPEEYEKTINVYKNYRQTYPYKSIYIVKMDQIPFTRGQALTEGVKLCNFDDLMVFIDVDMMFNKASLVRIRTHTIKNHQAYFPIVFSEYNPEIVYSDDYNKIIGEKTELVEEIPKQDYASDKDMEKNYVKEISDETGYFRQYGFGILSIFKTDFQTVGGFNLTIKGWGFEDVELFETILKSNITVFRIADETLVHIFHTVDCDKNLDSKQMIMCVGTLASTYGSEKQMVYYMVNHKDKFWSGDNNNSNEGKKEIDKGAS